jgi:hypothetical protein
MSSKPGGKLDNYLHLYPTTLFSSRKGKSLEPTSASRRWCPRMQKASPSA